MVCSQNPTNNNHLTRTSYVDSQISNADYLKLDGSNFMTAPLNMEENRIENMTDPVNEQDSVNNRYLEIQLIDYLKSNGSEPFQS